MNKPIRAALLTAKALYDKLPHVVGGGAPMARGGGVGSGIFHEPSHAQISGMVDKSPYKELRMTHHPEHGLFAWPAEKETHMGAALKLHKKHGFDMEGSWQKLNNFMVSRDKDTGALLKTHTAGRGDVSHPVLDKIDTENVPHRYQDRRTPSFARGGVAKDIPQIIMPGDHPARIDTRLATGAKPLDLGAGPRVVNLNALRATPALFDKNVDILRSYPNISEEATRMSNHDLADHFVGHVKDNLLWLHDQVPHETRQRSKQWYDGANKLAKEWAKKYGVSEAAAAGALAALSPQKDWFQNVSLAERVMDVMKGRGANAYHGETFSPEMEKTYRGLEALATEKNEPIFQAIKGKSLGDIDKMKHLPGDERATLKALWIRMHDQTHNDPSYKIATPEGHFGELARNADGSPSKAGWGSLGEIAKAVQSIESNGEPTFMNRLMGERHKVRNFYNNILDPHSPHGDVTIDTHAVAAGLLRALSGNSLEVAHNFNNYAGKGVPGAGGSNATGVNGTYPLYADAYRQAAKERGILPREMQSITWEAIRGLFPDTFKTAKNNKHLDSIWNDYRHGRKGIDDVRKEIHDFAGGIRPPEWHDTSGTPDAPVRGAGDAGVIPGPGSRGPAPIGIVGGTGDGPPGAPAPQAPRPSGLILPPGYACGGVIAKALAATRPR